MAVYSEVLGAAVWSGNTASFDLVVGATQVLAAAFD